MFGFPRRILVIYWALFTGMFDIGKPMCCIFRNVALVNREGALTHSALLTMVVNDVAFSFLYRSVVQYSL